MVAGRSRRERLVWAGYAAAAWGLLFAGVSFYWGGGGTLGLDTLGGSLAQLARARDPEVVAAAWITGLLKVAASLLALALVSDWGRRLPGLPVAALGWGAAIVLTLYGSVPIAGEVLVVTGAVHPAAPIEWMPLLWHLYLWDMSFLVWGILFGLAAWRHTTRLLV
jgi:hypothetical protein